MRYLPGMEWKAWVETVKSWAGSWPAQAVPYFVKDWGLNPDFAQKVALLYLCLVVMGLNPRVTSGFRDPKKQQELVNRWNAGDRKGFIGKPASPDTSRHCRTTWTGGANSMAIDMPCSDNVKAAHVARALGLRAGVDFNDPGHYDAG